MVGLAICYDVYNYGSMFQAYATQRVLDNAGIENEVIDTTFLKPEIIRRKYLYFLRASLSSDFFLRKKGMLITKVLRRLGKGPYSQNAKIRSDAFTRFAKKSFRMSKAFRTFEELTQYCESHYKAVVVGSDQLWLPGNIAGDYYTLNFVPDGVTRISYATSFGQATLPRNIQKRTIRFLNRVNDISVREETGKMLVKNLTGRDAEIVCDPTLLLSRGEWDSLLTKECQVKEKYILCYFLGNNPSQREWARRLKEITGCRIIGLLHLDEYIKTDDDYIDEALYDIDPVQFISLVKNASYICTDSFHCSVFSILYHKDFYTFRRYTGSTKMSTNSRLDNLYHMAGISRQILLGKEDVGEAMKVLIDYQLVDERIAECRRQSKRFLMKSLTAEGVQIAIGR